MSSLPPPAQSSGAPNLSASSEGSTGYGPFARFNKPKNGKHGVFVQQSEGNKMIIKQYGGPPLIFSRVSPDPSAFEKHKNTSQSHATGTPKKPPAVSRRSLNNGTSGSPATLKSNQEMNTITRSPSGSPSEFPLKITTPVGGSELVTRRSMTLIVGGVKMKAHVASPVRDEAAGARVHARRVNQQIIEQQLQKIEAEAQENPVKEKEKVGSKRKSKEEAINEARLDPTRGGTLITGNPFKRQRKSLPDQAQVTGFTAKEAVIAEIVAQKDEWDPKKIELLKELAKRAIEHLHAVGVSLAPTDFNPQTKTNLGVSGSWNNTGMMVPESLVKHYKIEAESVSFKPEFVMMPNSPLIKSIKYEIHIKSKDREITLIHEIRDALKLPDQSNWPSITDAPNFERVINAILNDEKPEREFVLTMK